MEFEVVDSTKGEVVVGGKRGSVELALKLLRAAHDVATTPVDIVSLGAILQGYGLACIEEAEMDKNDLAAIAAMLPSVVMKSCEMGKQMARENAKRASAN